MPPVTKVAPRVKHSTGAAEADVVSVKRGFARNALVPQGKAFRATKANLPRLKTLKEGHAKRGADELAEVVIEKTARKREVDHVRAQIEKLQSELAKLLEEPQSASTSTSSAPTVVLPELYDETTGRLNAEKMARFMGLALKPFTAGLGLSYTTVHRTPSSAGVQPALRAVKRSLDILHHFFGPAQTIRTWLNTPHLDLSGKTPLEAILQGQHFAVHLILENAWNGVPV